MSGRRMATNPLRGARAILLACLLVALVAVGAAFALSHGDRTRLAVRFQPGQSLRYRLTAEYVGTQASPPGLISSPTPFHQTVSETLIWRVASVGRDGTAVIDVQLAGLTLNGSPSAAPVLGSRVRLVVATDGRVLSAFDPGILAGPSFPGLDQVLPVLPAGAVAVRPGAAWHRSFNQGFALGAGLLPYAASGRFLRLESDGGARAAVIRTDVSSPIRASLDLSRALAFAGKPVGPPPVPLAQSPTISYDGTVKGGQTSWLDPADGLLLRTEAVIRFDMTMDFQGFPALFPTFDPGAALNPFGGLSPGTSSGQVALEGVARISLRLLAAGRS
jgi:hypothetical protein